MTTARERATLAATSSFGDMCGIAFVLQHAQVRCSACGAALLSYQEECDHRRLVRDADDNNEKESRASNEVQGNGGVAREVSQSSCNCVGCNL